MEKPLLLAIEGRKKNAKKHSTLPSGHYKMKHKNSWQTKLKQKSISWIIIQCVPKRRNIILRLISPRNKSNTRCVVIFNISITKVKRNTFTYQLGVVQDHTGITKSLQNSSEHKSCHLVVEMGTRIFQLLARALAYCNLNPQKPGLVWLILGEAFPIFSDNFFWCSMSSRASKHSPTGAVSVHTGIQFLIVVIPLAISSIQYVYNPSLWNLLWFRLVLYFFVLLFLSMSSCFVVLLGRFLVIVRHPVVCFVCCHGR